MSGNLRRKGSARDLDTRERESRPCRRCGAEPGRQCVTSSGTGARFPHAERRNDSRRAEGYTGLLETEGWLLGRFPRYDPR